jgi:GNAT superfamily N-acetyltransferase
MAAITIERVHGPTRRAVIKGLMAYNTRAVGKWRFERISVTLRHRGAIVGGLAADTYLDWMFIALFWIDGKFRGKGFGSKIILTAEKEARKRGVKRAYVDTFSFQAPGFYKRLGYREYGRLKGFPAGHARIWLSKAL